MSVRARPRSLDEHNTCRDSGRRTATIAAAVRRMAPAAIELRHQIHRFPELGNREFNTANAVADRLRQLGLQVTENVAHTGVIAVLRGALRGPTVAVRADMDALPVTERTDLLFRSTVRTQLLDREVGVSHACGHDMHTAIQVGVAAVLASMRDRLPGTIKFIFQPAEEGPPPGEDGGASMMIREGALRDPTPTAIFALHSHPELEVGQIGYTVGPAWAAVDRFRATLHGVPSHGARPEFGVDPILMAAEAVLALQCIRSRNLSALEPSVISVGAVHGGERFNILPEKVNFEGTVRTYNEDLRPIVERRLREIIAGVCLGHGGSFEFDYEALTPPTINDAGLARGALTALAATLGAGNLHDLPASMGGEDFAHFALQVPGFYFRLGTTRPGGSSGGLHTPTFIADDSAIEVGIRAMVAVVMDALGDDATAVADAEPLVA